jgi:hypothetical protein
LRVAAILAVATSEGLRAHRTKDAPHAVSPPCNGPATLFVTKGRVSYTSPRFDETPTAEKEIA